MKLCLLNLTKQIGTIKKNDDINIYAQNITDTIITAAKCHVPNKNIKVRQSDPPWLNNTIRKMIRKRKRFYLINLKVPIMILIFKTISDLGIR